MLKRFFTPPDGLSYFLFGPRGTGKTTWLKKHYPNAFWVNLLDPETFRFFSAGPEKLRELLAQDPHQKVIVIDEVQKAPDLLNVVHWPHRRKKRTPIHFDGIKFS